MVTVVSSQAHPDDEALLSGGYLAQRAPAGDRLVLVSRECEANMHRPEATREPSWGRAFGGVSVGLAKRRSLALLAVCSVLVIGFSGSFGRAHPTGRYRPDLPAAALTNGCWSLPDGVVFDFANQVRSDREVVRAGQVRRRLVMQFDLIGADQAREMIKREFVSAGFKQHRAHNTAGLVLTKPGIGRVNLDVTTIPGVSEESIVRGTIVLDMPMSQPESAGPVCSEPYSTKRFPADWHQAS